MVTIKMSSLQAFSFFFFFKKRSVRCLHYLKALSDCNNPTAV